MAHFDLVAGPGGGTLREMSTEEVETMASAPQPRRLIPKSVIQERINEIGKLGVVMTALLAQPLYFSRWFAPNHPNVYFDDADMLALLDAVGCTPDEIATVTA